MTTTEQQYRKADELDRAAARVLEWAEKPKATIATAYAAAVYAANLKMQAAAHRSIARTALAQARKEP